MTPGERLGHLLSRDLLEALESLYPAKAPDPRDSDREIWMKAGERRLVETLQAKLLQAEEDILNHGLSF